MPKILFFAHDPGGANAIKPLIKIFKEKKYIVFAYSKGPATKILNGLPLNDNSDLFSLLLNIMPDILITGTSANDFTEKYLWEEAKKLNIKSIAILDHWANYGIRFSKYGLKSIDKYISNKSFEFLPSYICVMDDFAKSEMINEGISPDIIYPFGNPHFFEIKNKAENIDVKKIRSKFLQTDDELLITFASEPYEEDYGVSPERVALKDIYSCLKNINLKTRLVIKLHPKEKINKYVNYSDCFIENEIDSISLISASDIVISMTSMVLIESVIVGKKCISYQPNESNKNKFILTKNNTLPFLKNKIELENQIQALLTSKKILSHTNNSFKLDISLLIDFIEKICQS